MGLPEKNMERIRQGVMMILQGLGEDHSRNGLLETPDRVAKLYSDVLDGRFIDLPPQTSFAPEKYNGPVIVKNVPFYAFCEHHMLPFYGTVAIGYIPGKQLLGLSKLVRIFRHACKRITNQERITHAAVEELVRQVDPIGAICRVEAEHTCMSLRGVKAPGSKTATLAFAGEYETDLVRRQQFLDEVIG